MLKRTLTSLSAMTVAATSVLAGNSPSALAQAKPAIVIFAAASLKNALDDASAQFTAKTGIKVEISYGGSLALARQLDQGANAGIFISADQPSMDFAEQHHAVVASSRFNLLTNRLVVIASKDAPFDALPLTSADMAKALGNGRLATGDVKSVPVGEYAKASLIKLGLWPSIEPHLAMADNVRAAMVLVARKEAPLGIVYATDAHAEPKVKIVATFPDNSHAPIVYPAAATGKGDSQANDAFMKFLANGTADKAFESQGFHMLDHAKAHS
ncbi:MAG: molybdate ABC transporter substrate-binding protein [Hyphomicrobiales bacterium]|nr:molybdate ABC transporter substrate-binding protein [Hyphomicrobiales bacterium]MDE2114375.1 molybdate ABC transporter substrate-binding protein [Hyphomicrobiales bacterium]